jgi:GNAT superfamily N-acetyltransferase
VNRKPDPTDPGGLLAGLTPRDAVLPDDVAAVGDMVAATGFFTPAEVAVAVELVRERLERGPASGYEFLLLDLDRRPIAYACWGLIACTVGSFDLYWIVVAPDHQRRRLGGWLLEAVERRGRAAGGPRRDNQTTAPDPRLLRTPRLSAGGGADRLLRPR